MPDNADITIANIPPVSAGGPAEATTLVEDSAIGHIATPGQPEPNMTDFGAHADPEDTDFFLHDIQKPEGEGVSDSTPAPEGAAAPAGNVSPPPAEPSPEPSAGSQIDTELLGIAESFGLSKEEAESYQTPQQLLKTLHLIARNLPPAEDAPPAPGASPQPAAAAAPPPEPELEFPDPKQLEEAGFDPAVVNMAKSMKAMHDRYKAKLEEVDKVLPHLVGQMQQSQAERRQRAVEDSFKEAGFDAKSYAAPVLNKIVNKVSALYKTYTADGEKPPVNDLIKTAVQLVTGGQQPAKPGAQPTASNGTTGQTAQQAALKRRADAAARAKLMERNGAGQFSGLPTHRRGGETTRGGALRQAMLDRGYDPGEATSSGDDGGGFLPG